jgi:acetylornithine deacetylase
LRSEETRASIPRGFSLPWFLSIPKTVEKMDLFKLTRTLIDIDSVTPNEHEVGEYLLGYLSDLANRHGGQVEKLEVAPQRFNVFARWGQPVVTLSTHMDTVPPFVSSREDDQYIWGRGACDAKGIVAAMIAAAVRLLEAGIRNFGLLFVVGEERGSAGAIAAAKTPRGSRYLINGEPTENRLALASKGALRFEIVARGKLAHSAYPELGHSAIHALLDVLQDIRSIPLPYDPLLGAGTLNIGTICGGHAPNIVADEARAEIMFRTVGNVSPIRRALPAAVAGRAQAREVSHTPALRLSSFDGLPTTVVSFATDIPALGGHWGEPFLIGPGSIHVAHTADEHIEKNSLVEAVEIYARMVTQLLASQHDAQHVAQQASL